MFDVEKEMKRLEKHLQTRPDEKLLDGYKQALIDYEITGDGQCKLAASMIKKEIDRRGLEVD